MNATGNQAREIFLEAIEISSPNDRQEFLERSCAGDADLRARVERLISSHNQLGTFHESSKGREETIDQPVAEQPGTIIGSYKLLQQIGEGGMGIVFMAEQESPVHRVVALKIVKPGMDTRQVIARFEAERQALALMDHSNISKVFDAGTTETSRPYFVMELVKGIPITEYCDAKRLTVCQRLDLFRPVCEAVQHAHQKGIIHRDLKPSNVLVAEYDGKPIPKIIDFGVAKATAQKLTERTMFTEFGQLIGTFEYMSPEQASFNQLDVDTRSDIYSLGVLLYELLTGTTPFEPKRLREAAFDEVLRIIREEEPLRPSTRLSSSDALPNIAANRDLEPKKLTGQINGELDWIVMRSLEKDRERRYQTAIALAEDIEHYLTDQPVTASPPSKAYRLKKFVRRNKAGVLAATAILSALIVGIVLASIGLVHARRQENIAKIEADKAIAVKTLLLNAIQSADPYGSKGSDYTVRELLNDVSANLADKLASQPEIEIEVRTTIGTTYRNIGQAGLAEPHLKRALELARRVYGPDDEQFAAVLLSYSQCLSKQGDYAGAESGICDVLRIYRLHKQSGSPFLHAMSWLCHVLYAQGKIPEAEAVGNEAVAVADASGNDPPEIGGILHNLAHVKSQQQEYAVAEQMLRRALKVTLQSDGPESRGAANVLQYLGKVLKHEQKYAESEPVLREALKINRRFCEPNHWAVRESLTGLRETLEAQNKGKELQELDTEQQQWVASRFKRSEDGWRPPKVQTPEPSAEMSAADHLPK